MARPTIRAEVTDAAERAGIISEARCQHEGADAVKINDDAEVMRTEGGFWVSAYIFVASE